MPPNARLVDWLSYARTMPLCDAVILHAGHGTLVRALACGVPVVACPAAGDMNENAARVSWAGAGVALPRRLITPRGCGWRCGSCWPTRATHAGRASCAPGPSATTARPPPLPRWRDWGSAVS